MVWIGGLRVRCTTTKVHGQLPFQRALPNDYNDGFTHTLPDLGRRIPGVFVGIIEVPPDLRQTALALLRTAVGSAAADFRSDQWQAIEALLARILGSNAKSGAAVE